MEILWKGTVSAQFWEISFHARKLGEITVFFAVIVSIALSILLFLSLTVKAKAFDCLITRY